ELGFRANIRRKWRPQKIELGQTYSIANRIFKAENGIVAKAPGELLAGDITYLKFKNKFYYLSIVMDLFTREIIGWSLNDTLSTIGISNALKKALEHRKINKDARVVFHSDRGSQYASDAYRELLTEHNIIPSMSRKGNCYDNAFVESFFKTFKYEFFFRNQFKDEEDLRSKIFYNIDSWYNRERLHSSLGYLSPAEYKEKHQTAA
ncbi:MAG: IS3 family transposase, partial [Chlamydiia bacterium]|nr:IS3 family transposase [Chlamydiia bacterium]